MKPNPVYIMLVGYQLKDSHRRHIVVDKDNIQYITFKQVLKYLGNRLKLRTAVTFHQLWPIERKLKNYLHNFYTKFRNKSSRG